MPTYEYRCTECDTALEVVQSIHEPALTQCPTCGGRLRKVFGNVGVVFKGSGFYRTDSRGKKTATTADKPAEKKPGDKAAAAATDDGAGSPATGTKPAAGAGSTTSAPASNPAPTTS